jgi:hypothetical protein
MQVTCSICGEAARSRPVTARSGKELTLWHCAPCDFDFLAHDPSRDLAANKLDESRLRSAGLDVPTMERDFANGLAQSQAYVAEYLRASNRGDKVLEIGCSWGYFLKLARDAGACPYGVELNALRARYVNEELRIPCDTSLGASESRGLRFRQIFLFYVLEYVPAPATYLQRLLDMLDEGGELVVLTPNLHDALKDLWRNEGFRRFFYDEHAINYLSPRAVERLVAKLGKRKAVITTRQGYSVVNHCSWFLTSAPRTTGVVGGDNFVPDIVAQLRGDAAVTEGDEARHALATQLADFIVACDRQYRSVLEQNQYGNQIRLVVTK